MNRVFNKGGEKLSALCHFTVHYNALINPNVKCIRLFAVVCLCAVAAHGFDNDKKGFVLGAGAGLGEDIIKPYVEINGKKGYGSVSANTAVDFDAKIGYNFTGRVELALVNKMDFMRPYSETILHEAPSIELSYYVRERTPSMHICGSLGWAFWCYPSDSKWDSLYGCNGFCFSVGGGLELIKHVSAQIEYQYSQPENTAVDPFLASAYSIDFSQTNYIHAIRLTVRYTFY
jgi:opacity protein-like surface antigen